MGGDMVVALGRAAADGCTLFGHNSSWATSKCQPLSRTPGREYAPGEKVRVQHLELPQPRRTFTVLGSQPHGCWGYHHGVNEHGVTAGCTAYRNKLHSAQPVLMGTDLVRIILERAKSARQAVDVLIDLLERHGQGTFLDAPAGQGGDHAFLVVDGKEAFFLETAGRHWVYQEIQEVRAASNVCTIRQDWNRISPGLSSYAIEQGWWPGDGSKLDFAEALSEYPLEEASAFHRWGRATLLLEQQNGHIDAPFLRRLLSDHYEGTRFEVDPLEPTGRTESLCQHAVGARGATTVASLVVQIAKDPEQLPRAGCAFGPPCLGVFFPIFLDGELPAAFTRSGMELAGASVAGRLDGLYSRFRSDPEFFPEAREQLTRLQADFDQEAEEFSAEGAALKRRGESTELHHLAGIFMQHTLEQFDKTLATLEVGRCARDLGQQPAGASRSFNSATLLA